MAKQKGPIKKGSRKMDVKVETPKKTDVDIISNIEKEIEKLDKKEFKFMFFVMDTKGAPNGELYYIYTTAKILNDLGYNVNMIHSDAEFMGVSQWLGDEYASLPHYNIETDGIKVSPSDFLIIPELFSNVMYQTMKMPCKRIVLLHNRRYMTELIQPGATWANYRIIDCVTSTRALANVAEECFPGIRVNVVKPYIENKFKDDKTLKKPFINIIAKHKYDVNSIVKEFFWKYPMYKWVGFRDITGLSHDEFSEVLKDSFATIWVDQETDFGYSAIEAMAANNLVVGKLLENDTDWTLDEANNLTESCLWFTKISQVPHIISGIVNAFLGDTIPQRIFEFSNETVNRYNYDETVNDVKKVYLETYVEGRKKELKEALAIAKNNKNKTEAK